LGTAVLLIGGALDFWASSALASASLWICDAMAAVLSLRHGTERRMMPINGQNHVSTEQRFDELFQNFDGLWLHFLPTVKSKYRSSGGPLV
jgi:hypothetical protein